MKVIQPHTITDSTLTSSTVTEADHSAWAGGTTYAEDDYVIVTTPNIHKIYKLLYQMTFLHLLML